MTTTMTVDNANDNDNDYDIYNDQKAEKSSKD